MIESSQPTFGDPYTVVYTVTNSAGLSASVRRTVEVADPCTAPFVYCVSTGQYRLYHEVVWSAHNSIA